MVLIYKSPRSIYEGSHSCDGDVVRDGCYCVRGVEWRNYRTGHPRQKATNANPESYEQTCSKSYYSSLNDKEKTKLFKGLVHPKIKIFKILRSLLHTSP